MKLPSVRKPVRVAEQHFERARGRARLVVKGAVAGLVAQAEIVGRDRQRRERDRRPARPAARRQRPASRSPCAPLRDSSSRIRLGPARKVAAWSSLRASCRSKREIERLGARLHPREMAVEIGDAVVRIEAHRLDQVEAAAPVCHERSLRQTFAPFVAGVAVRHDAGAEPEPRAVLARRAASASGSRH